jgi:hypothetical protein
MLRHSQRALTRGGTRSCTFSLQHCELNGFFFVYYVCLDIATATESGLMQHYFFLYFLQK